MTYPLRLHWCSSLETEREEQDILCVEQKKKKKEKKKTIDRATRRGKRQDTCIFLITVSKSIRAVPCLIVLASTSEEQSDKLNEIRRQMLVKSQPDSTCVHRTPSHSSPTAQFTPHLTSDWVVTVESLSLFLLDPVTAAACQVKHTQLYIYFQSAPRSCF